MNTPTLETERLMLRKFTENDLEALYRIHSDKEVNRFLPWFSLKTLEDAKTFYERQFEAKYAQKFAYNYAICLKEDNYPIGYVNVNTNDSHDFGYGLRKEFWHKGIVTEAGIAVVEQLRKDGIPYITATHDINNPRSGAVMKQLGMKYQYSYEEQWMPKDILVTFRMYQLNLDETESRIYKEYWNNSTIHFIEADIELLDKICQQYNLGKLETVPVSLKGGFMHKMYSLFTDTGKYAIKLLNPFVVHRETALENFQNAEELELVLETNNLPIIPALLYNGSKMQKVNGQFFYLYQWYDGQTLKNKEIEEIHCAKIGRLLAEIHGLDRKKGIYNRKEIHIDWDFYTNQFSQKNKGLYNLLKENRSLLLDSERKGNIASKKLPPVQSICHNDLDSKNVLWLGADCSIIDLECLSYSNPFMELYETALCWSGYEECNIDYNLFSIFIHSYAEAGGSLPTDWEILYDSNNGRLEWLEYNMKRSLGIECSKEEIEIGISEVNRTMAQVIYYHSAKSDIINSHLCNIITEKNKKFGYNYP